MENEDKFEIVQLTPGLDIISAGMLNGDGTVDGSRSFIDNNFEKLENDIKSSVFERNDFYLIKRTPEIDKHFILLSGQLSSFIDSINGSHIIFLNKSILIDGVALRTLYESDEINKKSDLFSVSKEDALMSFDAIFSKDSASVKIVSGEGIDENKYNDAIAILSGTFHPETIELMSIFGRVVSIPSYFERASLKKRAAYVVMLSHGLQLLQASLDNKEGFSKNVLEDIGSIG